MGSGVEYTLSGDAREIVNALLKVAQQVDRTEQKLDKMSRKGKKGSQEGKTGFEAMAGGAMRFGTALAGAIGVGSVLSSTISAIRAEFTKTIEVAEKARARRVDVAGAFRTLQGNFTPDATVNRDTLPDEIGKIANETGTGRREVAIAAGKAFSASELSNAETLEAIKEVFRLAPGDAEFAGELAAGAVDIADKTGAKDVRPIIGQLLQAQRAARVQELPKLVASAVPAVASSVALGDTSEQGFELFAALSKLATDKQGESTRTAQISLGQQLRDFVPDTKAKGRKGEAITVPQEQIDRFEAAQGTTARIEALQQSPELRESFLAKSSFEKRFQIPVEQVLSNDDAAKTALGNARKKIGGANQAAANEYEEFVEVLDKGPGQDVAKADRRLGVNVENQELAGDAVRAQAKKILDETLAKVDLSGLDSFETFMTGGQFAVQATDDESAVDFVLTRLAKELEAQTQKRLPANVRAETGLDPRLGPDGLFTGGQRPEDIQLLRDNIAVLRELKAELDAKRGPRPAPVPRPPAAAAIGN